jgi:hypothetical protein
MQRADKSRELELVHGYNSPAELFMPKHKSIGRHAVPRVIVASPLLPRPSASQSRRCPSRQLGAWMQVGEDRFNSDEITKLYESSGYPLQRDVSRQRISWRATSRRQQPAPKSAAPASIELCGDGVVASRCPG